MEGFKCQLGFNNVLTNKTKVLVYEETQEASLVRVQDSITMGAILGNLQVIMQHTRWQVIRVDFNLRRDDGLRTPSLAPFYSHLIAPVQSVTYVLLC